MRLSNELDQSLIRSAVSDAGTNLLSFIPSLGVREVFTFGPGVAVPTRMRFVEIPENARPSSEAAGNTRSDVGTNISRDLMSGVIERRRTSSMSHRISDDEDYASPLDSPALQPSAPPGPPPPAYSPAAPVGARPAAPLSPGGHVGAAPPPSTARPSVLRKPPEGGSPYPLPNTQSPNTPPPNIPGVPSRFR
jgi:hypothetical protein